MSTAVVSIPTGTYTVDAGHSRVEFAVKHLGIATVKGSFGSFEGFLEIDGGLETARAYGTVDVASIDTNEPQRDEHLRSADFFEVEKYPKITFESTSIRPTGDDTFEIVGQLDMHGVKREIVLNGELLGTEIDPWGNERVGLELAGQLNRGDFGLTYNQVLGSGNLLVSDKVKISLDISAVKSA